MNGQRIFTVIDGTTVSHQKPKGKSGRRHRLTKTHKDRCARCYRRPAENERGQRDGACATYFIE